MKVLIAEDDTVSRRLIEGTLQKWGYEVAVTTDGPEALMALSSPDAPRLAILDWMMPGMDGVQICRDLRKQPPNNTPYTYLILLTVRSSLEDLVTGMDSGADDYIIKPFDPQELRVRLRAGQRIVELQNKLLAAKEALRIQATYDALTGLSNRGAIRDVLKREYERSIRTAVPLSIAMIDLDNFKAINDAYGHAAGDEMLQQVARILSCTTRSYDVASRYGGEEFLVILPACNEAETYALAERLRMTIEEMRVKFGGHVLTTTITAGIATITNVDYSSIDAFIRAADDALYKGKNAGKNRVVQSAVCKA